MKWTAEERAVLKRFADEVRNRILDETPSGNGGSDFLTLAREQGYRQGHNDATRAIVRMLEGVE